MCVRIQVTSVFFGAIGAGPCKALIAKILDTFRLLFWGAQTTLEGFEVCGYSPVASSAWSSSRLAMVTVPSNT